MNFREARGQRLEWINTGVQEGFSNFLFIDQRYRSSNILRRIFSLARKLGFNSLLIERIDPSECDLLVEEDTALKLRQPDFQGSEVHRFSFFSCRKDSIAKPEDFLGYAVFKSDLFSGLPRPKDHVYEAVLPPYRTQKQNNFIHCSRLYQVNTTAGTFPVHGVIFAQQNDMTFVCAHAALRTALASILPHADITYGALNGMIGVDHTTRMVGASRGLGPQDIESILTLLNIDFEKLVHEPRNNLNLPNEFQRDLYGYIESGFPALVGFETHDPNAGSHGGPRHIIPVIGHTFNEDTWVADAQRDYFGGNLLFSPSENWLSTYVVHDDNYGPYYCAPRHFLKKDDFRIMFGLKRHSTECSAVEAEALGLTYASIIASSIPKTGNDWYDRFAVYVRCGWLVLRTLLVKKAEYLGHLGLIQARDGTKLPADLIGKFDQRLPDYFWLIEASAPELFSSSRRKFGEILLSSQTSVPKPLDLSLLLAARLPGLILWGDQGQLSTEETAMKGHTELFSFA